MASVRNAEVVPLISRITQRKRLPFADCSNTDPQPTLRRRLLDEEDEGACVVDVQRFTLVSRGAPPTKRAPAEHKVMMAPPSLAAELGEKIHVCRCSECPRAGSGGGTGGRERTCRRDTECHSEYSLLMLMCSRFETECSSRRESALVTEACCREKSAFFILGPKSTTVGYVAAVVAANRRVPGRRESGLTREMQVPDTVPMVLHIYVEPEYRGRGYGFAALSLLLRGHDLVLIDDPPAEVLGMLKGLGFETVCCKEVADSPTVLLARNKSILDA